MDAPLLAYSYADFEEEPDPSHQAMCLAPVLRFLRGMPSGGAILDAGCGGGDFAEGLAGAGRRLFGLDLSSMAIAAARRRGCGDFRVGSVYDDLGAPFGRTGFDAVMAIEVIEHLYSPRTFLRRAHDVLAPGGLLVVSTPYWGYAKNLALAITGRIDKALTAEWDGGHIKHFSRRTLTRMLADTGFDVTGFAGISQARPLGLNVPGLWSGMIVAARRA